MEKTEEKTDKKPVEEDKEGVRKEEIKEIKEKEVEEKIKETKDKKEEKEKEEKTSSEKKEEKKLPEIHPGDTIKVYERVKEKDKIKIHPFEGVVIAKKHGEEIGATITVRAIRSGVGMEKIFPIHSPIIEKIEIIKRGKVRRAKLYYLRKAIGKKAKVKEKK